MFQTNQKFFHRKCFEKKYVESINIRLGHVNYINIENKIKLFFDYCLLTNKYMQVRIINKRLRNQQIKFFESIENFNGKCTNKNFIIHSINGATFSNIMMRGILENKTNLKIRNKGYLEKCDFILFRYMLSLVSLLLYVFSPDTLTNYLLSPILNFFGFDVNTLLMTFKNNKYIVWFLFIIYTPTWILFIYRCYVSILYIIKIFLLKLRFITEIKSPIYDLPANIGNPGLFKFLLLYTKNSIFNILYSFLISRQKSFTTKFFDFVWFIYSNLFLFCIILLLPSPTLIKIVLYLLDIIWNYKKYKKTARSSFRSDYNPKFIEIIRVINSDRSAFLFYKNFTSITDKKKILFINNNFFLNN